MATTKKAQNKFFQLETLKKPIPKNIFARICIIFGIFLLEQIAMTPMAMPLTPAVDGGVLIAINSPIEWILIILGLVFMFLTLWLIWYLFKKTSPKKNWELLEIPKLSKTLWAVGGFFVFFVINFIFVLISSIVSSSESTGTSANEESIQMMTSGPVRPALVFIFLFIAIIGPIAEELIFRGVLMNYFFANKPWLSIILSAIVFGMIHIPAEMSAIFTNFSASSVIDFMSVLFVYGGMGFLLAFIYRKTGKIQYSSLTHILWNSFSVIITLALGV